jgi:hypothetical protein
MPGIIGWATLRRSKQTNLLQMDHPSLTVKGLARPSPKRLRAGRSEALQENHPYGPRIIFSRILIFSHLLFVYSDVVS